MVPTKNIRGTASNLGITGTPGVGKKSIAPLVAKILRATCISLNDLALSYGLTPAGNDSEVDTDLFRRMISSRLRGHVVLHGHLLPYVLSPAIVSKVIVLRCEPSVLKERLTGRGYTPQKIKENVEAELIGLLSSDTYRTFGPERVAELDTTYSTPTEAADSVIAVMRDPALPSSKVDWIPNYDSGMKLRSLLSME